jgi:hypothetical protein
MGLPLILDSLDLVENPCCKKRDHETVADTAGTFMPASYTAGTFMPASYGQEPSCPPES